MFGHIAIYLGGRDMAGGGLEQCDNLRSFGVESEIGRSGISMTVEAVFAHYSAASLWCAL